MNHKLESHAGHGNTKAQVTLDVKTFGRILAFRKCGEPARKGRDRKPADPPP
jgi:hypothetical protein